MSLEIRRVGPEQAEVVHGVVLAAFGARPPLDPPTEALLETPASIGAVLAGHGGLVADLDGRPVAALLLDPVEDLLFLRRFGVVPDAQHHGIAHRLVAAAVELADTTLPRPRGVAVLARHELPRTIGFWRDNGFSETGRAGPYVELVRWLPARYAVEDTDAMRRLGRELAGTLRAGDLVVLDGELGAGKTTFTQGLGEGLGVRGAVTSPTFVIAREHPPADEGPALVHVDAYRLAGVAELDDLDLDTALDDAVTVVEWGGGVAEVLAPSRLQVRIDRRVGDEPGAAHGAAGSGIADSDPRQVEVLPVGPRWR